MIIIREMSNNFEQQLGALPENWFDLGGREDIYGRYSANIVASISKVEDVFNTFCFARSLLLESHLNLNDCYLRASQLISALIHYVICWDLSWQVLFLYYGEESDELLCDDKYYQKVLNQCDYTCVRYRLTLARDYKVRSYIEKFEANDLWNELRETYNYYKHRGSFYIPGLGLQYKESLISYGNGRLPLLCQREFDLDLWERRLVEFNREFLIYFNNIIFFILPKDYFKAMNNNETIACISRIEMLVEKCKK